MLERKLGRTRGWVSAGMVGGVLACYDSAIYAFVAIYISRQFFPHTDGVTALLSTFLAYGLGFVVRPLGAVVIGRIGDVYGRKRALFITVVLMAIGTGAIGILPTYSTIGYFAPLLLVFARLLQGFASGGEWGNSTAFIVEWAPIGRRGFYGSFQQVSVVGGLLLGSGVVALLATLTTPEAMESWGWRIPFILGVILGSVGVSMRRAADEAPAYERLKLEISTGQPTRPWALAARAFGFTIVWTVAFFMLFSYMPTYADRHLKTGAPLALWANTIGLFALLLAIPLMGKLSDRVGRKLPLLACCVAFVVLPYPVFSFLLSSASPPSLIAAELVFAIVLSMFAGPAPAAISEIFPTRARSMWMTMGYTLSVVIFGGFAPSISIWLIDNFNSPLAHTFYLIAAAAVSMAVITSLPETAHEALK
jgi:MHS family proline/betaine transporter-like MFS transporter